MDYRARFYSPTLGRFTQPDSIVPNPTNSQSWNRLTYVNNNPVNYNDPTGHYIEGACGFAGGNWCLEDDLGDNNDSSSDTTSDEVGSDKINEDVNGEVLGQRGNLIDIIAYSRLPKQKYQIIYLMGLELGTYYLPIFAFDGTFNYQIHNITIEKYSHFPSMLRYEVYIESSYDGIVNFRGYTGEVRSELEVTFESGDVMRVPIVGVSFWNGDEQREDRHITMLLNPENMPINFSVIHALRHNLLDKMLIFLRETS
jgi:hypothetical protein